MAEILVSQTFVEVGYLHDPSISVSQTFAEVGFAPTGRQADSVFAYVEHDQGDVERRASSAFIYVEYYIPAEGGGLVSRRGANRGIMRGVARGV